MKYIDPESLLKLSNLHLRARTVVEGFISGMHESPYRGYSLEFVQHREYAPGDELRHIDWKIYGKTDKFFVKQFRDETNMRAYILLDTSQSMLFKSDTNMDKLTYGVHLVAALSYLLLHQKDSVGVTLIDSRVRKFIPSRANLSYFSTITEVLENIEPGDETKITDSLGEFSKYLKRRGLIILISDLFDEPESILQSLRHLKFKHHDLIVFQIIDPAEANLPFKGRAIFESLETEGHLRRQIYSEPELIQSEYSNLFNTFIENYTTGCRQYGIDYCLLKTDTPFEIGLGSFLASRKA